MLGSWFTFSATGFLAATHMSYHSAWDVDRLQISVTPTGRKPTVKPRPLARHEIRVTVADFGRAARNALVAGFDGVQILANYLYLISQFLNSATNLRKDEYGEVWKPLAIPLRGEGGIVFGVGRLQFHHGY
jgi:2,4-dienoyl-CoA reductase-like NADH-dependent reductase (Old Yellow Enzyme family)